MVFRGAAFLPSFISTLTRNLSSQPLPIRSIKGKSRQTEVKGFVDIRKVRAVAGKGGDGEVSFLQLWANDSAGPDGGDGGNGGHVIVQACTSVKDLNRVESVLKGEDGERGWTQDCHGKNASHTIVKVPIGTVVKDSNGVVLGDLHCEGAMYILARGGAGGHGNHFFTSATQQSPKVAEYGAHGEDRSYFLEIRSIANFGLVGFPNAGKSTILQAISRARPKVAPYPFTTLKPHLGIVPFSDFTYLSDLPGIIKNSHKNHGLGIDFLRHIERCSVLILVVDASDCDAPKHISILRDELKHFSNELASKPQLVIANKIDLPEAEENLAELEKSLAGEQILPVSAKYGQNILNFLIKLKELFDKHINNNGKSKN